MLRKLRVPVTVPLVASCGVSVTVTDPDVIFAMPPGPLIVLPVTKRPLKVNVRPLTVTLPNCAV